MIRYTMLQFLFLVITTMYPVKGMNLQEVSSMISQDKEVVKKVSNSQNGITSSTLEDQENLQYKVYKKITIESYVSGIAFNEDNTKAVISSFDGIARVYAIDKEQVLKELKGHKEGITSVALSTDGRIALTGSYDQTARVWNTLTGETTKILPVGFYVTSVALSADGSIAVIGYHGDSALLYNTSTGEILKELKGHTSIITSVALSSDGSIALTGSLDGTARLWDTLTGKTIKILKADSPVSSVALSAHGSKAFTGTTDKKALIWDVETGALLNTLLTDGRSVKAVALSKDGKMALTGTNFNTIQVWNTEPLPGKDETSTPLTVLSGHTEPITALAFGGDDLIASSSEDETALIWKRVVA